MYISKSVFIFILSLFLVASAFAQEKNADTSQSPKPVEQIGCDGGKIGKEDSGSIYRRISERENLIRNNAPLKQIELLRLNLADKDTIIEMLKDIIQKKNEIIENKEDEVKIIDFFRIEDTSIFSSESLNLPLSKIPLCLQSHYGLIIDIRRLDSILCYIEKKIVSIESQDSVKNLSVTSKQIILKSAIKKDLDKADLLIGQIEGKDKSGLYEEQKRYYRPFLIDKFNGFLDKIYN